MQVSIRNKWISLRGGSTVKDMNEKDVLYVKGKFFTFTRKKFVQDMSGNLLYTVRNKFWTFFVRKALVYDKDGNQVAFMKKKFWSFHDHYFIETKLGQMEIRGNILCFDYHISLKGKEIGHVSRKISLRDSFVLDLDDEYKEELPFFVALVIAIDNITDQRRDDNSNNY
ncbi:MAG: LURP-one-related family protein [Bacilli bacterium]|nr:LURP-one-related family protein [Bacilli bacterium]